MNFKTIFSSFLLTAMIAVSAFAQNSTVVVTGNTSTGENIPGWMFNRDSTSPATTQLGNASIGSGSLFVGPIASTPGGAYKFVGEYFSVTPLADVDSISYDFKLGTSVMSPGQYYMNVYVNLPTSADTKFYDCRYNVVPTSGLATAFTTVTFDPTSSYSVSSGNSSNYPCPASPASMPGGSKIRAFSLNLGDSSTSDAGYTGFFDKVVVATTSGTTTFDFEPVLSPSTADSCKKGGWMTFNTPAFKNQGQCVSYIQSNK